MQTTWDRMGRIRLFPLLFENGCSQSSRFLPQARRIVGSGDENEHAHKQRTNACFLRLFRWSCFSFQCCCCMLNFSLIHNNLSLALTSSLNFISVFGGFRGEIFKIPRHACTGWQPCCSVWLGNLWHSDLIKDNLVPRSLVDEAEGEILQTKKICVSWLAAPFEHLLRFWHFYFIHHFYLL